MIEERVLSVGELNEDTIDAFVDVARGLLVHSVFKLQLVVLDLPRMHGHLQTVHLVDEVRVSIIGGVFVHDHLCGRTNAVCVLSHQMVVVDPEILK